MTTQTRLTPTSTPSLKSGLLNNTLTQDNDPYLVSQPSPSTTHLPSSTAAAAQEVHLRNVSRNQDQTTEQPRNPSPPNPQDSLDPPESGEYAPGGSSPPGRHRDHSVAFSTLSARAQDHLKLFFSMHHKLFDLVAFYVVMFAINGQMTSLPTRLEWIGFCVQSIVALRRAFQTSIKHGIGLTSFLGMLDLLVGQLFLHQDRLGLLPTVANILVYFYVINLTRGLVFGDSVSCLLWFLFGLVDIYRKDPSSSSSVLDITPYKVIPVHTVGFGLYILMSELVDVMLHHSAEPDPIQGRYLNYVGAQKEGPVSIRSSRRSSPPSSEPSSGLRFELCITEITPFTVSFCLNALSDPPLPEQDVTQCKPSEETALGSKPTTDTVDVSSIRIGPVSGATSPPPYTTGKRQPRNFSSTTQAPRIISTSDIAIHVNYIPWREVQYHFPDEQSFTLYGLTPSTDYEIEMKVHHFSSFVTRIGTRAAPPGTVMPIKGLERLKTMDPPPTKTHKNRKAKKNQKKLHAEKNIDSTHPSTPLDGGNAPMSLVKVDVVGPSDTNVSDHLCSASMAGSEYQKSPNQVLLEQLQMSIQASTDATHAAKASIKKIRRDQTKAEALLRQELEGIGRGQAKVMLQDQKRRQKLSFLQESIKQTDAQSAALELELEELRGGLSSFHPELENMDETARGLEQSLKATFSGTKDQLAPFQEECRQLEDDMKLAEDERADWLTKADQWREQEVAPLQLRLQRLEQQKIVWEVAAAASKNKDRETALKIAALEDEIEQKSKTASKLEGEVQILKESNGLLKSSVEKEMEQWEFLERELDTVEKSLGSHGSLRGHVESNSDVAHPQEPHFWFSGNSGGGGIGMDLWQTPSTSRLGDSRVRESGRSLGGADLGSLPSSSFWDMHSSRTPPSSTSRRGSPRAAFDPDQ